MKSKSKRPYVHGPSLRGMQDEKFSIGHEVRLHDHEVIVLQKYEAALEAQTIALARGDSVEDIIISTEGLAASIMHSHQEAASRLSLPRTA